MKYLLIILISSVLMISFVEIDENQIIKNQTQEQVILDEGEALVYIIRPSAYGFAQPYAIYCDTVHLGTFRAKSYFYYTIPEGKYKLRSPQAFRKKREFDVVFNAGETYYVYLGGNAELSFFENQKKAEKSIKKFKNGHEKVELSNGITKYK